MIVRRRTQVSLNSGVYMTKLIFIFSILISLYSTSLLWASDETFQLKEKVIPLNSGRYNKTDILDGSTNQNKPDKQTRRTTSESDKIDAELLNQALGKNVAGGKTVEQQLQDVLQNMQQVKLEMSDSNTGKQTQQLQKQVITDLTRLIKQLEKMQRNRQGSTKGNLQNVQKKQPESTNNQQETISEKSNQTQSATQNEDQPSQNSQQKSAESSSKKRNSRNGNSIPLRMERLEKDVWGHLPPSLRNKLINIYSDQYLPAYDELIRQYFESLAEQKTD